LGQGARVLVEMEGTRMDGGLVNWTDRPVALKV
jgi:hypothetical protein